MNRLVLVLLFAALFYVLPGEAYCQKKAGGPPPWAPAHGYRAKTRHIYFPEHNFYFDMQQGVYIYLDGGSWGVSASLPTVFGKINLRTSTQIELDLLGDKPQAYNADHKGKYKPKKGPKGKEAGPGKGKGRHKNH